MFCFHSKAILHGRTSVKIQAFKNHNLLYILQTNPSPPFSTTSNQQSFTVSYLIRTCGLSPEYTLSASKRISFQTPTRLCHRLLKDPWILETPNRNHRREDATHTFIKVEKTLLPKITFFNSKGISSSDPTKLFAKDPKFFESSLEKKIIPSFNFLSNLFQSDNDALGVLILWPRFLQYNFDSCISPNINVLRNGVPELNIVKVFRRVPHTISAAPIVLKENVEKVKKMGFNPERFDFIIAVCVLGSMSKSTWERKSDVYKKCGWSEKEILEAFRRNPSVMAASEDKIKAVMDFLVNVMAFQASSVAKQPYLLGLSMEKRIVPRGLFVKDLISKGLLEKELGPWMLFGITEEMFLKRFVYSYEEGKASELLKLYNEKLKLAAAGGKLKTDRL